MLHIIGVVMVLPGLLLLGLVCAPVIAVGGVFLLIVCALVGIGLMGMVALTPVLGFCFRYVYPPWDCARASLDPRHCPTPIVAYGLTILLVFVSAGCLASPLPHDDNDGTQLAHPRRRRARQKAV